MAMVERKDCKDYISVYVCATWEHLRQFKVDSTDLTDLAWAPDGSALVIWDNPLDYKLLVYSPDGRLLSRFQAYENALGIRSVSWSPSSQFVSVGSYDQKLRLLNHITWKVMAEFNHPQEIQTTIPSFAGAFMYKEVGVGSDVSPIDGIPVVTKYIVVEDDSLSIPTVKLAPEKPNPKLGVSSQSWSPDARLVFTKNANMPSALWIWDVSKLALAAIVLQIQPIKMAMWDPNPARPPRLALCTANGKIYFWRSSGCSCVGVPAADFVVNSLEWSPDGNSLLLISKDRLCCCYLPEDW